MTAAEQATIGDPREEIATHIPALRAFAMSLTRNHAGADDLVQDTIVKAWTSIDKFAVGSDLRAWLFTILRNSFFSVQRKRKREVADPDGVYAGSLSEKPAHDSRMAFNDFLVAFNKLSAEHREVLILVGANGYSYDDAAAMMGVAPGTAKSRASRARAKLAEMMGMTNAGEDLTHPHQPTMAVVLRSGLTAA